MNAQHEGIVAIVRALPASTSVYIALLAATFALHVVFMHYAVGAVLWTLVAALRGRFSPGAPRDTLAVVARDWLPSSVSGAITAGIAPLLFVQIVYQKSFYTANLLLFNRWMALLPALIVAIYAMYVVKAHGPARILLKRPVKAAAAIVAAGLVGYVALAFVENHLLSLAPASWTERYAEGAPPLPSTSVWLRLAMWLLAALPTFAALAAWQLRRGAGEADDDDRARSARPLAATAIAGAAGSLACGAIAWSARHGGSSVLDDSVGRAAFATVVVAQAAGAAAWIAIALRRTLVPTAVTIALTASLVAIGAHSVLREAARLLVLAGTDAAPREPADVGGLGVFLASVVLGIGAIAWILRVVARALAASRPN